MVFIPKAFSQDRNGMQTSVAVDLIGAFAKDAADANNRFEPRSIDMLFHAPIDHMFTGTMSVAAHREDGEALVELHEAFLSSTSLLPGLKVHAGQFFLGIGRLNRFHQHEWPFITTPIVHERFLGTEGVIDSGVEFSYLLPLPFYLDITGGVTNGYTYGHSHDEGERPLSPTHYSHIKSFFSLGEVDFQPGLSYLRRVSAEKTAMQLLGIDLVAKKRAGKILSFLFQSEIWQRRLKQVSSDAEIATGAYVYPQFGFDLGIELGLRLDYFTVNSLKNALGEKFQNSETALTPLISYRPSEFSCLRLGYSVTQMEREGEDTQTSEVFEFQITYLLGAHPAHDF